MRITQLGLTIVLAAALAAGVAACGGDDEAGSASAGTGNASSAPRLSGSISGAGATFPQPLYGEWAARFKDERGVTVNYQGIGSGGGIAQFTAGTVDFGATDAAMTAQELEAARKKGDPVHVPSVFGAVTVAYNVPGVETGLKLDGKTVADLFLGRIANWSDPALKSANPGVDLPDRDVTICHRSDESGTTKLFTTFLGAYSKDWKDGPGVDKSVKWPTGTGAKGNDGVAACIQQNDGAVGYVEQAYALANKFATADLKNRAGDYVPPSLESTSAAGEGLDVPSDLRFSAIDAPGKGAYPIASATFLLVNRDMCRAGMEAGKAKLVKAWLDYALSDGQAVARELQYAPLPAPIKQKAQAKVDHLQCDGAPIG